MKTGLLSAQALGLILAFCVLAPPHAPTHGGTSAEAPPERRGAGEISRETAIKIATDDAVRKHAVKADEYEIDAAVRDAEWRVVFERKNRSALTTGGVIEYRIDKETGRIIDGRVYQ